MNVNRRSFLLASAAAAAASAQKPGELVRTAVIGTGNRGSHLLRGVIEQPVAKVVALCDIKPDRLDKAATAAARDNPATTSEWRRVLDRKDVDAVFIATPPHLHSEMAVAALQAGKHVYCEKPIGITPAQVRDLVRAARASKCVFTAGQQMRSSSRLRQVVQKLREGAIGDVIMVKAQRHAATDLKHDGSSGDWFFDVNKGGGYLIEQSVHNLDVCNWAAGQHPSRACGFGGILFYKNDPPGRTIFDCGLLTYEYANGVKLSFTQNVFHPRGLPAGGQYTYVFGTKGAVDMSDGMMYPSAPGSKPEPLVVKGEADNQHIHIIRFYDCILKGGENPSDITIGATAALTSILGHQAMVKGTVVKWSDMGVDV